jgi:four helix bundle protein
VEAKSNSYRDLIAWQRAVALVTDVYRWTEPFPKSELYGLTSQMRRAAVSVATNIAEGQARNSVGEFRQFVGYAKGSLVELETHMIIASNLGFISPEVRDKALRAADEVSCLIKGLLRSLEAKASAAGD